MKGRNPAFIEKIFQARRDPMHKDPTPHLNYLIFILWPLKKYIFFSGSILAYSGLTLPSTMEGITHGGAHPTSGEEYLA